MIPYGRQDITQEDIDAVVSVLKSDFLTTGPQVGSFEKSVSQYTGSKFSVAVNSGTSALHAACFALEVGSGDCLWTVPNTFVASSNCGLYLGARVDFVDIDEHTYNMCPVALEEKLIKADKAGKLPKVVIPVHFSGQPCEMKAIHQLGLKYGFKIIEDASHAIGADYLGKKVGSCEYSDITVFSFHPVKIVTSAEGGAATTNNEVLAKRMARFRTHGVTRNKDEMKSESDGPWYYQQIDLGFNYRITDLQCALGISQIQRLDQYVSSRRAIAARYSKELIDLPYTLPYQSADGVSSWHLYVIQASEEKIGKTRRQVFEQLRELGIGVNVHYIPVHTQPYYQELGFRKGQFPVSEAYYSSAISIPMYAVLSAEQQVQVIEALAKVSQT